MLPADGFVHHVGSMAGLGTDYLPSRFVELVISCRYVIVLLAFALVAASLAVGRLASRSAADPRRGLLPAALLQATAMLFLAIPCHQIPDEVFVSLIQSKNLGETGRYSFYPDRNVDGTGDGRFYVATGALHAAGIPAPLGATLLCALFGAAAIGLRYRYAFDVTRSHGWSWGITLTAALLHCSSAVSRARDGRRRCSRASRSPRHCCGDRPAGR